MNLRDTSAHWVALHEELGLGARIANKAQYQRLLGVVSALMEDPTAVDRGPMGSLVALLADRIREYEARCHPWPDTSTPASALAALMAEHGLRQADLLEAPGASSAR